MGVASNAEGVILDSIEGTLIGLDAVGNLVLNTKGKMPTTPPRGAGGVVGRGIPYNLAISAAAGAANVSNVSYQVQDVEGNALTGVFIFDILLSDAATGAGLTGTTASGGIAAAASGGAVIGVLTTSKALKVQTTTAGLFKLAITDTSKTGFYPCAQLSHAQTIQVGAQLVAGNYG